MRSPAKAVSEEANRGDDSAYSVTEQASAAIEVAGRAAGSPGVDLPVDTPVDTPINAAVYTRNVLITGVRLMVFAAIGVLLPAFLTHRLSTAVYGAWILVLQLSNYISYLDLGAQTGVSKYIAEFTALKDRRSCNEYATAGMVITLGGCLVGILASVALAWLAPVFFHEMPAPLLRDLAHGVLLVGISTAVLLATSSIGGMFLGLQRYAVPVLFSVVNKTIYALVLVVMVLQHRSLTAMGVSVAAANVITACGQVVAWRRLIPHIEIRPKLVVWPILKRMLLYCAVLGVWTSGMIIISGLDTTIVGHYSFGETAFYAVAAVPVVFLNQLVLAALAPLMPATSALSVTSTPKHLGTVLECSMRYSMLVLLAASLPLVLFGYSLLSLWVGPVYASHALNLMRVLLVANVIRNACLAYCGMVLAIGMQKLATLSGICEAAVNLATSIVLGKMFGAIGVAMGTLIGAVVGVLVHFFVSMRRTQGNFAIRPPILFLKGGLRPCIATFPTLVLLPVFWRPAAVAHTPVYAVCWTVTTVALMWQTGLNAGERVTLRQRVWSRLSPATA